MRRMQDSSDLVPALVIGSSSSSLPYGLDFDHEPMRKQMKCESK
jgi:hypothetical protein